MPSAMVKTLKASSTASPTSACNDEEDRGAVTLTCPDGIGRERVRSTLRVEIAIDDVVPGAAGAAHGEGADEKQSEVREARSGDAGGDRGKRRRPPARQQQQPGADRAVEAREPQVWTGPGRRDAYRPNCRSHRRPNRPPGSSCQRIAVECIEGSATSSGVRSADRPMGCRSRRSATAPCGFVAGPSVQTAVRNFSSFFMIAFGCWTTSSGIAAPGFVFFEEFHHGRFRPHSKRCTSAQISLRSTLCSMAARMARPSFRIVRNFRKSLHCTGPVCADADPRAAPRRKRPMLQQRSASW